MVALRIVAATAAISLVASQNQGREGQCIGERFHQIDYDYSDEKDENGMPESFTIQIQPKPEESSNCLPTNGGHDGDRILCVGMNTGDCQTAREPIKIKSFLECEECFIGVITDLFYNISVEKLSLKYVNVGIRDSHLRGKAVLHFDKSGGQSVQGTFPIVKNEAKAKISFSAGPIPVNIKFSFPMELEYDLELQESVDLHFGGGVDVNLGDHYLSWTEGNGFEKTNSKLGVTWTPTIVADGQVTADLPLTIKSSMAVELENIIGWNVHFTPAMPLHASLKSHFLSGTDVCLSGEGDIEVKQDADLHFNFAGFHHTFANFGPSEIYHRHWNSIFNKCVSPNLEDDVVV